MPKASVVSVGTSATVLNPTTDGNQGFSSLLVQPQSGTIYVGGAAVTTGTGFPVGPGATLAIDVDNAETVYGVAAAATSVNVLQTSIG